MKATFLRALPFFRRATPRPAKRPMHRRLALEVLEDRRLLTTFTVTNTNDSGNGSLRDAIDDANASGGSDKIIFAAAVQGRAININSSLPSISDDVTIKADNAGVTVDAGGRAGVRPFYLAAASATLKNLTITGGRATAAGDDGGGIYNAQGVLTLSKCVVSNNRCDDDGGGIYSETGTVELKNSRVTANASGIHGGGIYSSGGSLTIDKSTIANNTADGSGAGVFADSATSIRGSTLSGNNALNSGGGMVIAGGHLVTIANSTFAHNASSQSIYGGGAILQVSAGTTNIVHTTIARNSAASEGGGILQTGGTINFSNSILALNTAKAGTENRSNRGGIFVNYSSTEGGDPRLGSLQDNGGPTFTMSLLPGSPLIDSGSNARSTSDGQIGSTRLNADQRGVSRNVDGDGNGTFRVDRGAVEFIPAGALALLVDTDSRVRDDSSSSSAAPASAFADMDSDLAFAAAVMNHKDGTRSGKAAHDAAFAEFGAL